jgi:hypothetical protein
MGMLVAPTSLEACLVYTYPPPLRKPTGLAIDGCGHPASRQDSAIPVGATTRVALPSWLP